LFGAAFAVGVAARAAAAGVDRLILAAPSGPFGLLDGPGRRRPLQAVHAALAAAAAAERYAVFADHPGIAAVAFGKPGAVRILVANLTCDPIDVSPPPRANFLGIVDANARIVKPSAGVQSLGPFRCMILMLQS
jgi:hypothetical protein